MGKSTLSKEIEYAQDAENPFVHAENIVIAKDEQGEQDANVNMTWVHQEVNGIQNSRACSLPTNEGLIVHDEICPG
ncbi:unnamed protein product [Ilex paraguariensis]|uniref:Uncharacterized protein n=1 Tax=Ilex paraguariensis TaxID=185542 RepID=A0ABC8TRY3_9AQUA